MKETVQISTEKYLSLIKHEYKLMVLLACGVDDWDGYEDSIAQCNYDEQAEIEELERLDYKVS